MIISLSTCRALNFLLSLARGQIKHCYRPNLDLVDVQKASDSLYNIIRVAIEDFGVTMEDFASCMIDSESPTEVAKTIRLALRDAFISRYCGRVWDPNTLNPSIFRDASIALLPSFDISPILVFTKLQTGLDDRSLPRTTDDV